MSHQKDLTDGLSSSAGQGGAAEGLPVGSPEVEAEVEPSVADAPSGIPAFDGASSANPAPEVSLSGDGTEAESAKAVAATAVGSAGRLRVAVVVLAALVVILLALLGIRSCSQDDGFSYDSNAIQGQAPYKTAEELQAELNRIVDEGMFNISIASVIRFADGASAGTAYIENVPGNRYDMQVTITLDSDGSEVYRSGVLAPDSYIGDITLSQNLAAGEYDATATFTALNGETHEEEGKAAAKISLVVG